MNIHWGSQRIWFYDVKTWIWRLWCSFCLSAHWEPSVSHHFEGHSTSISPKDRGWTIKASKSTQKYLCCDLSIHKTLNPTVYITWRTSLSDLSSKLKESQGMLVCIVKNSLCSCRLFSCTSTSLHWSFPWFSDWTGLSDYITVQTHCPTITQDISVQVSECITVHTALHFSPLQNMLLFFIK